jgi:hypothetical protein
VRRRGTRCVSVWPGRDDTRSSREHALICPLTTAGAPDTACRLPRRRRRRRRRRAAAAVRTSDAAICRLSGCAYPACNYPLAMHKTVGALASLALSLAVACVQDDKGPRLLTDSPHTVSGYGYQGPRAAGYRPVAMPQAQYWVRRREIPRSH